MTQGTMLNALSLGGIFVSDVLRIVVQLAGGFLANFLDEVLSDALLGARSSSDVSHGCRVWCEMNFEGNFLRGVKRRV